MPEDALVIDDIGFRFFSQDNGPFIVNDHAVHRTLLEVERVRSLAFDHLGAAREAVQAATRRKLADDPEDRPDGQDIEDYVPGDEFFF